MHSQSTTTTIVVLTIFNIAVCTPTPPPLNTLSLPQPSTNLTASNGNCASSTKFPSWSAPNWNIEDCYSTVNQLYLDEVLSHPDTQYEFIARGASTTQPKLTGQRTPRKYVVRSCVVTIMMLDWFHPGQLPNGKGYLWPQTDVSTYRDVYTAAKGIETACTQTRTPGWAVVGDASAMGVFVWATGSQINEMTGGFPVISSGDGLNVSDVTFLDAVDTS